MTFPTVRRPALGAALVLSTTLALASCATGHGSAGSDQQIAASCPATRIASTIGLDMTGSFQSDKVKAPILDTVASEVRRTAICGGHLRVFAFASSTGATVMLYDGDLVVDAPTENARLRKATKLAEHMNALLDERYDVALQHITGNGSDPLGMLTLFQQANAAHPDHVAVNVLLTDGVSTIGVNPVDAPSPEAARTLADQQQVPDLSGAQLSIIGVGKQGAGELPSATIANLTAFWEQICRNTGAGECTVSTEGN